MPDPTPTLAPGEEMALAKTRAFARRYEPDVDMAVEVAEEPRRRFSVTIWSRLAA